MYSIHFRICLFSPISVSQYLFYHITTIIGKIIHNSDITTIYCFFHNQLDFLFLKLFIETQFKSIDHFG